MRKLVLTEFVTINGVMEAPHRWNSAYFDEESFSYKLDELMATDALLLGRVTFDVFAEAWPGRTDEQGFADRFNSIPKYVVSTTLKNPEWNNSHVIRANVVDEIKRLKEENGQDIAVHGSGLLAKTLMAENLIDEYRLMVSPVVVNEGQKLFPDGVATPSFELVDVKAFSKGNVVLTYRPEADEPAT